MNCSSPINHCHVFSFIEGFTNCEALLSVCLTIIFKEKYSDLNKYLKKYVYLYLTNWYFMKAANYSEFRSNLKQFLDEVEYDNETLIIKRGSGNGTVLISLDEFNSMTETRHLLSSKANAESLHESIQQVKTRNIVELDLSED